MKKEEKKDEVKKEKKQKLNDHYKTVVGDDGIEILNESPDKSSKLNNQTLIIILLAFSTSLLAVLVLVKKDVIFTSNEVLENNNNLTENSPEMYYDNIPVEDTYALATGQDFGIQFYVLHNGRLYYKIYDYAEDGNYQNYRVIDYNLSASYDIEKNLTQYNAITGIRRIKTYSFSDSVSYSLLLITQDGSVYKLTYQNATSQFTLTKLNIFGNNKVDNIINLDISSECTSSNCAASYEIITKDGQTVTK